MLDPTGEVRSLEHLAFNAWPALQTLVQDDWILRFAHGYTKRANSVNAVVAGRDTPRADLERRIAQAEALYRRQDIRCVFRLSPLMDPQVGSLLQARGWAAFDKTVVMVADLAARQARETVIVAAARNDIWSTGYMTFNGVPPTRQAIHDRMLDAIVPQAGFAMSLDDSGEPAAFGLGVIERGHIGLFDIVSDPARRRAGHGHRLVEGLLSWGHANGAARAYLHVVADNARAIALYDKLGFREAYRHHYRAAPG